MSFKNDIFGTSCVWMQVEPGSRVGNINGLDKRYSCVAFTKQEAESSFTLYNGEKQGLVLLKAFIRYCRWTNLVDKLEVGDTATWECPTREKILISINNMLLGHNPYYMKVGFLPSITADRKIKYNIEHARSVIITDRDIQSLLDSLDISIPSEIVELIESRSYHNLIELLQGMIFIDCGYYSRIYTSLFERLQFKPLIEDETRYYLDLSDI